MTTPMVFYKYGSNHMEDKDYCVANECKYFGEKDELKEKINDEIEYYEKYFKDENEYIITQFNNDVLTKKSYGDDFTEYMENIYIYKKKHNSFEVKEDGKCYCIHPCGEEELIEGDIEMENYGDIAWFIHLSSHYVNKKKILL